MLCFCFFQQQKCQHRHKKNKRDTDAVLGDVHHSHLLFVLRLVFKIYFRSKKKEKGQIMESLKALLAFMLQLDVDL